MVSARRGPGRVPGSPPSIERVEREVLVVSIDRLIPVLRSGATGLGPSANELGMRGRIGQRRRLE